MPKAKVLLDGKMVQQNFYMDKLVVNKLKAYALETGTSFYKLIKPEFDAFNQALLAKVSDIDKLRLEALNAEQRRQELQALADQHPLVVSGHEEDPVGEQIEQPAEAV